jgi:hypothetical protein
MTIINSHQLSLPLIETGSAVTEPVNSLRPKGRENKVDIEDRPIHNWYRFVLSYPPHLVREYIHKFELDRNSLVLDPFCGTGTTLVESKLSGIPSVGLEANPFAHFASSVKTDWNVDPEQLQLLANHISSTTYEDLRSQGIDDDNVFDNQDIHIPLQQLDPESTHLLITNSISPLPLHKALILLGNIHKYKQEQGYTHLLLAFASALVYQYSNLHFGPEVGVGRIKKDVPVVACWQSEVKKIIFDLRSVAGQNETIAQAYLADSRQSGALLTPNSIDAVITSPPYPNEKDYTRTTRLESVMLGFIKNRQDLKALKRNLIRSNTRGVYKGDDDDRWLKGNVTINKIAEQIEQRRIELGKDSGFEKLYGRVTLLYFGGMAKHFADLRSILKPGAQLAYVVGDQASYLRVMIRTGELIAMIAQDLGYEVTGIDLFRTRFATASQEQLREEVVLLKWPGEGTFQHGK